MRRKNVIPKETGEKRKEEVWSIRRQRNHPTLPLELKNHLKPTELRLLMHPTSIKLYRVFSPSNTQIGEKEQITLIFRNSNETEAREESYISKYSRF